MSQNNTAAQQNAESHTSSVEQSAGRKERLSPEELQALMNHPDWTRMILRSASDKAVRRHKYMQAAKYIGIGGVLGLIGYGAFRLSRAG